MQVDVVWLAVLEGQLGFNIEVMLLLNVSYPVQRGFIHELVVQFQNVVESKGIEGYIKHW